MFLRTDYYGHASVGGSFSHTKGFLDGLQQLGHESFVVSSGALPLSPATPFYHVPYSRLFQNLPEVLSIAYNTTLVRRARRIIRRERPDFIYHRHSEFHFSSSALARESGIPLVLEFNGSEVWVKKHWGIVYLEVILRLAEEVQLLRADIIAVVSQIIKDDLVRLGVDEKKILVNPNGVDPDQFHPEVDGSPIRHQYELEGKIIAGFVGTFGAWHGVEVMARAIKPTVEKDRSVHFFIVGDGALRAEVERIIRDDGVGEFVTLTGSVSHSEIPKYLAACDILLSPHVHNADGTQFFGSPTKLFEYMAMAKPIVASGVGQIGDIIQDGENGLLMKERDHTDLAEKILMLCRDVSLRERLGAAARHDAIQRYSWKQNAQRVIDAVQPLLNR
ncbi:MAG TPA: glycosyltransferase family 4 protein [Bacteroidota bacterium]